MCGVAPWRVCRSGSAVRVSGIVCVSVWVALLVSVGDMTHLYVWHDSLICFTWLVHMCRLTHSYEPYDILHPYAWQDLSTCVTWLIHMCDTTYLYRWHGSLICVIWLIHMRDTSHSYAWHDSFICVTWIIHVCNMTHSYGWHDSFICRVLVRLLYTIGSPFSGVRVSLYGWHDSLIWVALLIYIGDVTLLYVWLLYICSYAELVHPFQVCM